MAKKSQPRLPAKTERKRSLLPTGYDRVLAELKARVRASQVRAASAVNLQLIELYWEIGEIIVARQRADGWGKSVVERLALDLQAEFPGVSGFSPQNIWKMRAFYLAYTTDVPILSQPVRELAGQTLPPVYRQLPWGHNTELHAQFAESAKREKTIKAKLKGIGYGG